MQLSFAKLLNLKDVYKININQVEKKPVVKDKEETKKKKHRFL